MASRYRPSPSHHSATPTSISELSESGFDARALDKRIEGAAQPLLRNGTARKLLLAHRIQIAPPCVAVTAPLGMQCLGRHVCAHEDDVQRGQPPAVSIEELTRRRASQPLLRSPCV